MNAPRSTRRDWSVYRVGLTGGIASGKSTVASLFAALGVPVIDTDQIARDVVAPGTAGLEAVVAAFGPEVLHAGRHPRPPAPAGPGLRDDRATPAAGGHPAPPDRGVAWRPCAPAPAAPTRSSSFRCCSNPGLQTRVDRVLVVDCSEECSARPPQGPGRGIRRGCDRLLAAQLDRATRLSRADDVLVNAGTRDELQRRVDELHATYLHFATALNRGGQE